MTAEHASQPAVPRALTGTPIGVLLDRAWSARQEAEQAHAEAARHLAHAEAELARARRATARAHLFEQAVAAIRRAQLLLPWERPKA